MSEAQKPVNDAYRNNWDAIWGKKEKKPKPDCPSCKGTGRYYDPSDHSSTNCDCYE